MAKSDKPEKRKRSTRIVFYVDAKEAALITEKMKLANIINREAYLRKMSLDGYVVRLDLADIRKMISLLQNATNNLNQIARHSNATDSIFESDIADIKANYEKLWEQAGKILDSLAKIRT